MDKLFLVDVSGYVYRAYFALPPMSNERGEPTHALYGFVRSLLKLIKDFQPTHIAAVFDGPTSTKSRKEVYKEYKAHRRPTPEDLPQQMEWAYRFCQLIGVVPIELPNVEADDAMGSIATKMAKKGVNIYLCTTDKDLAQLVNPHVFLLNTYKDNLIIDEAKVEELYGVKPNQIVDLLALMGDASDNIPGVQGFGQKTAAALLNEGGSLEKLLAHPEKILAAKKREALIKEADQALLSQKLAQIHIDLDCPATLSFFDRQSIDQEQLRAFYREMNFTSLLKELPEASASHRPTKKEKEEAVYAIVNDPQALKELMAILKKHKEIVFDTETTDLRPTQATLVGIGFAVQSGQAWYVPTNGNLSLETVVDTLKPLFESRNHTFVGHNVKYDLHVLKNHGIDVAFISFDTMVASYLLNSHSRHHDLDHLALTYFEKVKTPIESLIGKGKQQKSMVDVPIEKVGHYCCEDADYTLRLKEALEPQLAARKLDKVFQEIELPLLPILAQMERNGIYVDLEILKKMSVSLTQELKHLEHEIHHLAGEPFNISSPKQLSTILYGKMGITPLKKTATGYSTDAEVLETLASNHPIAKKILDYRSLDKLLSTYVDALPSQVNPKTQRIHCTFNQSVAATGRLSCQDPNLQNIPIRTEQGGAIRSAFKPQEKGWIFLSADYSQIELRLLAHLSEDPHMIEAFARGEDIHAFTASLVFGTPLKEVSKEMRHKAKAVNFGIIYGQQAFGLSRELAIPMREASQFIEAYFQRFPKIGHFIEICKEMTRKTGRSVTMTGRERLIPEIHSRNAVQRALAERLAINAPLQGSAADLIKLAMIRIDRLLQEKKLQTMMILQVHDELLFEAPPEEKKLLTTLVKEAMEGVFQLRVPLVVNLAVGNNWKEC